MPSVWFIVDGDQGLFKTAEPLIMATFDREVLRADGNRYLLSVGNKQKVRVGALGWSEQIVDTGNNTCPDVWLNCPTALRVTLTKA
jgi:hypothetical protein